MNQDIHQDRIKRQQEHRRDHLTDSASPEPRAMTPRGETHKKIAARSKERTRQLAYDLEVVKEGMDKLRMEMESVWKKMNAHDQ
ncbi:unnamed protein product [Aureobasidium vineae]|uniref:Uncharacterized protein n=1 Tax=Aureobasidium vineae TaxID=2773715 RepID=A0A9N8JRE0_9PEZI|nr:unnamed protein product [Aureobasidium vineae]